MKHTLKNLIPVTIESPIENWHKPNVAAYFGKMVALKMKGYGHHYPFGTLPVDTTDFIGSHILVCCYEPSGLRPVMGFKTITRKQSEQFALDFPGLTLVKNAHQLDHIGAIEAIMADCKANRKPLAYTGSWTVDPLFTKSKEIKELLRDLFVALYTNYYLEQNIENNVLGGTLRFKTELLFERLGHQPISLKGKVLPPISITHLQGEQVLVMHAKGFSEYALETGKKYQNWWRSQKLEVGSENPGPSLKLA